MSKNAVKALLSSIGLTGFLLILGYLIDVSQQDLLGFQIRNSRSIETYLFLGGSMLVSTFLSAVLCGVENILYLGVALVTLVAGAILLSKRTFLVRQQVSRFAPLLLAPVVIVLAVADIILLDAPAFQLKDVLRGDLKYGAEPSVWPMVQERGRNLWKRMICSRFFDESSRRKLQDRGVECLRPAEWYTHRNRDIYLLNVLLGLIQIGVTWYLLFRYWESKPVPRSVGAASFIQGRLPLWYIVLPIGAVLVNMLLLPWTFGRLQASTVLKEVIVQWDAGEEGGAMKIARDHGFVLSEDEDCVVVFHKKERHLWFIPRDRILLVKVERHKDVIAFYFGSQLQRKNGDRPPSPPPPPPL